MLTFKPTCRSASLRRERGSFLIEALTAMVVLALGLGGLFSLLMPSLYTNSRSSKDTSSTMVAEHVLEQISAQPANSATALSVTDCAGTAWTINTQAHALGAGSGGSLCGDGGRLTSSGEIDWSQDYSRVPARYAVQYVDCGIGRSEVADHRPWHPATLTCKAATP